MTRHDENLVDGKYSFEDLVDVEELRRMFESFSAATGYTTGLVTHPDQKLLIGTGWRDICTNFHRATEESEAHCRRSNRELTAHLKKRRTRNVRKCECGLVDGATPIIIENAHVANLFTGQFLFEEPDLDRFRKQAEGFGYDIEAYFAALDEVPVITEAAFAGTMTFLGEMAVMLAEQGLSELRYREMTDAVRVKRENLESILNSIGDAVIVTDMEGIVTGLNPAAAKLTRWSVEEAVGESLPKVFTIIDSRNRRPIEELSRPVAKKTGIVDSGDHILLVSRDRSEHEIVVTASSVRNVVGAVIGAVHVFRDVSEELRIRKELRQLATIVEQATEGIAVADLDGKLLFVNHAWASSHGFETREELLGMHLAVFHTPEQLKNEVEPFIEDVRRVGHNTGEVGHLRQDGTTFPSLMTVNHLKDANGTIYGMAAVMLDITERNRIEEELARSEAKYRGLIETSSDLIWEVDADGVFTYVSPQIESLMGYTVEEVIGKTPFETMPPGEVERVGAIFANLAEKGEPIVTLENVGRHRDGHEIIFETSGVPVFDAEGTVVGYRGIDRDITARKRADEELSDSLQKLALHVEQTPLAVIEFNLDFEVTDWNPAAEMIFGWRAEEVIGRNASFIIPEKYRGLTGEVWENLKRQRGGTRATNENLTKSGDTILCEWYNTPLIGADGKAVAVASLAMDVTERRRAEDEKRSLERQIQHAQKLKSLGVLAGGIAHDFNNLLMAIQGNVDLALEDLAPGHDVCGNIEAIGIASRRAAELARQMLDYSGRGRFVVGAIDANDLVEEIARLLQASISKKVRLEYRCAPGLPFFEGDETQIRQVIMNLVTNASEAIGDESGTVTLSTGVTECDEADLAALNETLQAGLEKPLPGGRYIGIEVADTGCGMPAGTIERVFDPFFTTKFTGRGLGMSSVLGIVRGHRGAISVDSEVGIGTTCRVLFPAAEPAVREVTPDGGQPSEEVGQSSGRILIVDDEASVCSVARQMVERLGFATLIAADGVEAVNLCREHADEIVCVLLDLTMPRMDGVEAFGELRRIRPDLKVVLCSGYSKQDATRHFVGQDLTGFLQKPFMMNVLREKLVEVLGDDAVPAPRD